MMFDFEWINANLFAGLYTRTKSFFDESELSSSGRPASAAERALLAPFPGAVRDDILEGRWTPPRSDGAGRDREMAAPRPGAGRAGRLAAARRRAAPRRRAADTSRSWSPIATRSGWRSIMPGNCAASASPRGCGTVDEVQYQRRRQSFDFDMMIGLWQASASPGNEQRMRWGGDSAEQEASYNLAGAKSPAVDAMIAALLGGADAGGFRHRRPRARPGAAVRLLCRSPVP